MSAAGQAPPNAGLPPGVSFEDAERVARGDMSAIGALVARFKLNKILPLQPEFIAFFTELPEDAWLILRQAMIDARIPIRDVDRKVKEKRAADARPNFDPSVVDDANSYGQFIMTKTGLFKAVKQDLVHVCVAFQVLGITRRALDPSEPKTGAASWGVAIRFLDGDVRDVNAFVEFADLHRNPSEVCAALAHVGMVIAPGRNEQQALAEYLIGHPSKSAPSGLSNADGRRSASRTFTPLAGRFSPLGRSKRKSISLIKPTRSSAPMGRSRAGVMGSPLLRVLIGSPAWRFRPRWGGPCFT
jgi:hypothetical protein